MNYVKIFIGRAEDVEVDANAFLTEAAAKRHRVMTVKQSNNAHHVYLTFVLTDEPHPHKKR